MAKRIWNLAIVEPHFIISAGLSRIFSRTAIKERLECATMEQLWTSLQANTDINVFLVDVGIDFSPFAPDIQKLKEKFPKAFIVLIADRVEADMVHQAVEAGIHGLIAKGMRIEAIVKSVELILLGEPFFPTALSNASRRSEGNGSSRTGSWKADLHSHSHHVNGSAFNLSGRELEVLMSLREGKPNKEIARSLDISDATVKVHVKAILRKLRMKNRTEAALWATEAGLPHNSAHHN